LVAEEFGELSQAVIGQTVEAALVIEDPMGGEDVEVRVEDEVVAESVHGGGGEAAVREVEDGANGVAQAGGGGVEEVSEQVLVAAAGSDEAGEAGGKVAAAAEGLDRGDGFRPERPLAGRYQLAAAPLMS